MTREVAVVMLAAAGVTVFMWTGVWAVMLVWEVAKAWRRQDDDRP
jgi:hypothetical protein